MPSVSISCLASSDSTAVIAAFIPPKNAVAESDPVKMCKPMIKLDDLWTKLATVKKKSAAISLF